MEEELLDSNFISAADINEIKAFNSNIKITFWNNDSINFSLPISILPSILVAAFEFSCSKTLLIISLELDNSGWDKNQKSY
jgi:hypothetical protein